MIRHAGRGRDERAERFGLLRCRRLQTSRVDLQAVGIGDHLLAYAVHEQRPGF